MTERLEHFGHPCTLPEAELVGVCVACRNEVYAYEQADCEECGLICTDCQIVCACGTEGCKKCIAQDEDSIERSCKECRAERAAKDGEEK